MKTHWQSTTYAALARNHNTPLIIKLLLEQLNEFPRIGHFR